MTVRIVDRMALIFHGTSMADNEDMFRSSCATGRLSAPLLRSSLAFGPSTRPSVVPGQQLSLPGLGRQIEEPPAPSDGGALGCGSDRPPCGRGWPAFWIAVLMAYGPTLVAEILIVSLAATSFGKDLNGGIDPCEIDLNGEPKSKELCDKAIGQVTTAQSISTTCAYGLAFFCSPVAGFLADRLGRKPVLFMSGILLALHAVALLAVVDGVTPYVWYASVALPGLLPANVGWGAVLVDRTLPNERAPVYAWLLAGENLDGVVLPLIISRARVGQSAWMIVVFMIVMLFLIVVFIPETMPKARREELRIQQQESNQLAPSRAEGMKLLITDKRLRVLSGLAFFSSVMAIGTQAILLLYFQAKYDLHSQECAPLFATYYGSMFFMNVVLMKPMIYFLGLKGLLLLAYFMWGCFSVGIFLVPVGATGLLYLMMVICCFAAAALPGFFALLNASVKPELRGQVIGAMVAIQSLGKMCGPLLYNLVFSTALARTPKNGEGDGFLGLGERGVGAPFLMSAVFQACSFAVIACLPGELFREEQPDGDGPDAPLDAPLAERSELS